MSTDEARDATRGSAVKLFAELVGRGLQLLTAPLLFRGLGASDFGVYGVLSSIAVVAAEGSDLGLQGTATPALVARTFSLREILRAKALLSFGFLLVVVLVWPFVPLLAPLLLYFAGAGWAEILGVALRARGRRAGEAAVIFVLRLSGLVLVAASLWRGGGLLACVWALALSTLPPCLLAAALLGRSRDEAAPPGPAGAEAGPRAVLRASLPLAVNGGLALLSLRVELLVMSALRSPAEVGYFLAALQVVQVLNVVPNALCAGAMPALTREALRGKDHDVPGGEATAVRRRTAATVTLAAVPAAIGLGLVAPAVTQLLYKVRDAEISLPLAVLALAVVPLFLNGLLTHALIASDHASVLPRLTVVRVVLAALLAALLVPALGGVGAALGFVLSELVLVSLGTRAATRARFPMEVARPVASALILSLPMAAAVWPMRANLPLAVLSGVLTYALAVALGLRISPRLRHELGYS